jgi:hypothetical protein
MQIPKGSFENEALLNRRDNFNEYFCSDASRFRVARGEFVSWNILTLQVCAIYNDEHSVLKQGVRLTENLGF